VRVTTALTRLMDLRRVTGIDLVFEGFRVVVTVMRRSEELGCPERRSASRSRADAPPVTSRWRRLDLGWRRLAVRGTAWLPQPRGCAPTGKPSGGFARR
jgi:hypothetical protein